MVETVENYSRQHLDLSNKGRKEPFDFEEYMDIQNKLVNLYRSFLEDYCNSKLKKDKIILLKSTFPSIHDAHVAKATGSSFNYVRFFKKTENGYKYTIKPRRKEGKVHPTRRKVVLERDRNACVWCGKKENLIVHHIIPIQYREDADSEINNLATLCKTCHSFAHGGGWYSEYTIYGNSIQRFWDWPNLNIEMEEAFGDIKGVGKRIITNLCAKFKNMEDIKKATTNDLESVSYVTKWIAFEIKKKFERSEQVGDGPRRDGVKKLYRGAFPL